MTTAGLSLGAAERFQVSWPTAKRWADRYRELGPAGMQDRSSRPLRQPTRTPQPTVRKIVHVRWKRRLGPVGIASVLGVPASTVHAVLRRCGISRLSQVDRATGEPVRRYEWPRSGDLLQMDVKKLGNVPDGGGWRFVGREQGRSTRQLTPGQAAQQAPQRADEARVRAHRHDDHSRVAYAEVHDDETAPPPGCCVGRCSGSPPAALTCSGCSPTTRLLSQPLWRQQCHDLNIVHKRTRPYRPQTNGKVERFHRTLTAEWAFRRLYLSESARRKARPAWIHKYNHHRLHTAIGKATPISRLTNLPGQCI